MWQMFVMLLNTLLEGTRVCSNGGSVRNYTAEHSWCFNKNLRWNKTVSSRWGKQDAAQLSLHTKFLNKLSNWSTMWFLCYLKLQATWSQGKNQCEIGTVQTEYRIRKNREYCTTKCKIISWTVNASPAVSFLSYAVYLHTQYFLMRKVY